MGYSLAYARQYPPYYTYAGEATNLSFEILWLPGQAITIRDMVISQWAERNGVTMIQLIIEDEEVGSVFGFPLAAKYRIEALAHTAAIAMPVIIALLAVVGVGVYGVFTWKAEEVRFGPSKTYYETVAKVIDVYSEEPMAAAKVIDQIQKKAPPPPSPSPGPIGEIGDIVKWGIVGLGVVMVLPTLLEMVKRSSRPA